MLITSLRKDRESLFQQGIQQGERDTKIATAKAMLAKDFESPMIAELLQLSLEEIERLQQVPNTHRSYALEMLTH